MSGLIVAPKKRRGSAAAVLPGLRIIDVATTGIEGDVNADVHASRLSTERRQEVEFW